MKTKQLKDFQEGDVVEIKESDYNPVTIVKKSAVGVQCRDKDGDVCGWPAEKEAKAVKVAKKPPKKDKKNSKGNSKGKKGKGPGRPPKNG